MEIRFEVNEFVIADMAANKALKEFSVFLYLKSLYSNSCIYNYTQKELSFKSDLSLGAIRKYVPYFIRAGWCRMHRGNLVFGKVSSLDHHKKKVIIKFLVKRSVKEIFDDLSLVLLKIKQRQFNRYKQLAVSINSSCPKTRRRASISLEKAGIKEKELPGENSLLKISMKSIANLTGVSVGSAAAMIKRFKKAGRIFCVRSRECIWTGDGRGAKALLHQDNTYYSNGMVFKVECNSYVF